MTALDFPNSPNVGDVFDRWQWDGDKWVMERPEPPPIKGFSFNEGRLIYESPTSVRFVPHNGDRIQIAGEIYQIPDGGVELSTTGGVYAGTVSYVFCRYDGMALQLQALPFIAEDTGVVLSRATDTTPGNVGIEIANLVPTLVPELSLVGMIYIDSAGQVQDAPVVRHVASWFNRESKDFVRIAPGGQTGGSFVCWSDEAVSVFCRARSIITTGEAFLYLDGNPNTRIGLTQTTLAAAQEVIFGGVEQFSEGYHTYTYSTGTVAALAFSGFTYM